jgi:hypothetical protein
MKDPDLSDLLLVVALDPLDLDHGGQLRLLDLHGHLLDLVLEAHLSHELALFLLANSHGELLLQLLPLDLPLKQLLGLVQEQALDLQLQLLQVRVALPQLLQVVVLSVPQVLLELAPEVLQLCDLRLVGLTFTLLELGLQQLARGGVIYFPGVYHRLVHGFFRGQPLLGVGQLCH